MSIYRQHLWFRSVPRSFAFPVVSLEQGEEDGDFLVATLLPAGAKIRASNTNSNRLRLAESVQNNMRHVLSPSEARAPGTHGLYQSHKRPNPMCATMSSCKSADFVNI